jgi:hypothetical protein
MARGAKRKPKGWAGLTQYFLMTKNSAIKLRGLDFLLTREEFRQLTSQNCYYCNSEPSKIFYNTASLTEEAKENSGYVHNGIDRIDNTKGYILDNCVPCCITCNRMKFTLSQQEFIEHIRKIYDRLS